MQKRNMLLDFHPRVGNPEIVWIIPIVYILSALMLGRIIPQIDRGIYNETIYFSPATATSLLSAIASGMITFTGFVFSMLFVMVQFGSSAYSPRLARYFIQDPVVAHATGIFVATFLYSLIALSQIDVAGTGGVPDLTVATAMIFLLASIAVFLLLIRRTTTLQINHVLHMVGTLGEEVIHGQYPLLAEDAPHDAAIDPRPINEHDLPPVLREITYLGRPLRILGFDLRRLVRLARKSGVLIEIEHAVGDMVGNHDILITLRGKGKAGRDLPTDREILACIRLGPQRTIEQDSRFAMRLIVDIAVHALSPAINDPTTAVQALDQLDDLLRRIGRRDLNVGRIYDEDGALRVLYPTPDWNDFLSLAVVEIRFYGATSHQVMRRLRALLSDLRGVVHPSRVAAVEHELARVEQVITHAFPNLDDQALAREPDRQGISIVK